MDTLDLVHPRLSDLVTTCRDVRRAGEGARTMEDVATRVVRTLYDGLVAEGKRACVLVRVFKTQRFGDLDPGLRAFAGALAEATPLTDETRCLVLLATVGEEAIWNDRRASVGHRAIPLASEVLVQRFPMISKLVDQLGIPIARVVSPPPGFFVEERVAGVFHVPEPLGSPYLPAQDFVRRHDVRSVVGFGGLLPDGDLYAGILFARVPVSAETALLFRAVAAATKVALLPFLASVFQGGPGPVRPAPGEAWALLQLLGVYEELVIETLRGSAHKVVTELEPA